MVEALESAVVAIDTLNHSDLPIAFMGGIKARGVLAAVGHMVYQKA